MPISRIPGVGLDTGSTGIGVSNLSATGTPNSSTFLRGDNTWSNPVGAGSIGITQLSATGTPNSTTFLAGNNTWSTPASPSGSVRQVVSTTLTSAFSSSTKAAWVSVTGLAATITPVSTSSRILIMVQLSTGDGGNNWPRTWGVARNGTLINQSTVGTGYVQGSFSSSLIGTSTGSNDAVQTIPFTFVDSPSSTSALTYQVQFNAFTSTVTTTFVNRSSNGGASNPNCTSNIILMEIA